MAHNLEIKNGTASFAENGKKERAWHRLGQVFDGEMTVATALAASHADYTVASSPVYYNLDGNGGFVENPDYKHIFRTDTNQILGLVTKGYGIVQNAEAFDFVNQLCCGGNENTPFIEAAGVLGRGERVFVTAKFPEQFKIGDSFSDDAEMYAVITTAHDGSGAVTVMLTPVRVVCNNTLQYAMLENNISKFSFRHTSGVSERLKSIENTQQVSRTLKCYDATMKAIKEYTDSLAKIDVSEAMIIDVAGQVAFGDKFKIFKAEGITSENISSQLKNVYNGLRESIENGIGQKEFHQHNGNWLFNGLSTYYQNAVNYCSVGQKDNPERKFDNIFGGTVHRKLKSAFNNIITYTRKPKLAVI